MTLLGGPGCTEVARGARERRARVLMLHYASRAAEAAGGKALPYYAYHGGASSVASFSARHDITGANIWTTAPVLMAFGQVLARLGVLQRRRVRAVSQPAASRQVPARPPERHAGMRPSL